jgi:outer membrane protein
MGHARFLAAAFACAWPIATFGAGTAMAQEQSHATRVMTLAEVEQVAAQQPQMLVARANAEVAEAQSGQAHAPMLPQVTAQAGYTRETANSAYPPPVAARLGVGATSNLITTYDYWNFGITASQLIYDFGQTPGRAKAASLNAESQRVAERTTRLQVMLTVRQAYFNARAMKDLVDVAKETLDAQNKHLMQVQGYVQVGTQPPIALAQQKAAVANAIVQLIAAQNSYETAKAQLNQAAGITGGTDYDVSDDAIPTLADEDQPIETLYAKAIAARPELASLYKQREAQEETVTAAKGGYGPTLSANAGFTAVGYAVDNLAPNWSVGALLNWPILQGGLTKATVRQAEAQLSSIDAQTALQELQVRLSVDSARLSVKAAKATIGAAEDAVNSAREQLRLAEQRYSTGVGNIIELGDAQVAYTAAAAQLVQARYGLASARAQLLAALGRT